MTNIIISDDEAHCINVLKHLIEKLSAEYIITGVFRNPLEGLDFIKQYPPDLLFLDIEMPNLNGFALLDTLQPINFDVIFTTAYDQYAVKAFRYSAINYLQKPITEKDIVKAFSHWENRKKKISKKQWDLLHDYIGDGKQDQPKIALPIAGGYHIVSIKSIVRCQSDNNYTYIFCDDENKILISRTLKEIDGLLKDHGFFRVHQSHLINPNFVKAIVKQDGGGLIMIDNSEIPVSRQQGKKINEILEKMLQI